MHPLAPKLGPDEAGDKLGKDARWMNFARRIQHHPAVKLFLLTKQSSKCPVCACGLGNQDTVHHVSYLARCLYDTQVEVMATTGRRAARLVKAPPCEGCPNLERCAGLLALVHDRCHHKIHAST